MNPVDMLSSTTSSGRRMPRVLKDERTDGVHVIDNPSRPCPGCEQVTREGESITRIFRTWWHLECARLYLRGEGRGEAWRVLVRTIQVGSRISVPTAELRRLLNGDPPPDSGVTLRLDRIVSLLEELVRLQYQSVSVRGVAS